MIVKIAVAEPMPTANATTAMRAMPFAAFHDCHACERAPFIGGSYRNCNAPAGRWTRHGAHRPGGGEIN